MSAPPAIRFSAVVLAAGLSTRMQGRHKLVLAVGGEPAIRRTVRAILDAQPEEVVVVTGHEEPAVREALAGLPIRVHRNPDFAQGQATSVAAGVAALTRALDAVLICLGDMVLLEAPDYREVVGAYAANPEKSIVVPHFRGRRGNPVLLAEWRLPQVISGHSNPGCRKLIEENPDDVFCYEASNDRFLCDMDTPQEYEDVLQRLAPADSLEGERA